MGNYHDRSPVSDEHQVKEANKRAKSQDALILDIFKNYSTRKFSPDEILDLYKSRTGKNVPLTSIRRAISNLTDLGHLEMTNYRKDGPYGKPVHLWRVKIVEGQLKLNF